MRAGFLGDTLREPRVGDVFEKRRRFADFPKREAAPTSYGHPDAKR